MHALRQRRRGLLGPFIALLPGVCGAPALAENLLDMPTSSPEMVAAAAAAVNEDGASAFMSSWADRAARVRAGQPSWSSPLVTTTALLEQRVRFDFSQQHAGNGANTGVIDGGRGLDLIVSDSNEIQIAMPPYDVRTTPSGTGDLGGFGDWPFLRLEQRLASSPESAGNYVVTTWLTVQAPIGIAALTSNAWTYSPTLALGKGWGRFDVQATVAAVLPASHIDTLGHQIQTNVAFQYHVFDVLWPQLEVNWAYWTDGPRGGLNQIYLTPGLVIGRFAMDDLKFTFGVGYQTAAAPSYRAAPLTPAYDHAWLFTSRVNF